MIACVPLREHVRGTRGRKCELTVLSQWWARALAWNKTNTYTLARGPSILNLGLALGIGVGVGVGPCSEHGQVTRRPLCVGLELTLIIRLWWRVLLAGKQHTYIHMNRPWFGLVSSSSGTIWENDYHHNITLCLVCVSWTQFIEMDAVYKWSYALPFYYLHALYKKVR